MTMAAVAAGTIMAEKALAGKVLVGKVLVGEIVVAKVMAGMTGMIMVMGVVAVPLLAAAIAAITPPTLAVAFRVMMAQKILGIIWGKMNRKCGDGGEVRPHALAMNPRRLDPLDDLVLWKILGDRPEDRPWKIPLPNT
jgi:hypothetical protein